MQHVAEIDFEQFYGPAFPSAASAQKFVRCAEAIPAQQSKAKIVLHQAARMLWLADRIEEVAQGRPALLILFYVIAAEAVAKLVTGFQGEGESKRHVRIFFEDICSAHHRSILSNAFGTCIGGSTLTLRETIDLLYDLRCDVVHAGQYFTFALPEPSDRFQMVSVYGNRTLLPRITVHDLRKVVLEGAVLGAARLLPAGNRVAGGLLTPITDKKSGVSPGPHKSGSGRSTLFLNTSPDKSGPVRYPNPDKSG